MECSAKDYLQRAETLLTEDSECHYKYACLELRLCIESLAYKKMRSYSKRVPEHIFSKWQPQQIITTLTELEPESGFNKEFHIFTEDKNGNPEKPLLSYKQNELTVSFIKSHYHKLGSYLHSSISKKKNNNLKEYLVDLIDEIKPLTDSKIYSTIAETFDFNCTECDQLISKNISSLSASDDVVKCFNPNCKAEYCVETHENNKYSFVLRQAVLDCKCGARTVMPLHKIKENFRLKCNGCTENYLIRKTWVFCKEESA